MKLKICTEIERSLNIVTSTVKLIMTVQLNLSYVQSGLGRVKIH